MKFATAVLLMTLATEAGAQVNAGTQAPEASLPFTTTRVAQFNLPWRIAFFPDGKMLITEKPGALWLVTQEGVKTKVTNVPAVLLSQQGGMLGVYLSPKYNTDRSVYLTYAEPGDSGSSLALARARLAIADTTASLEGLQVIWRDGARGRGGQFGAAVAFSPDQQFLFLTVGDRQRMTPAQDPNSPLGKILRLTLDGKPAPGNPQAGKTGAPTLDIINPPRNTEIAKTAPTVNTYTFPGPNLTPSETWTSGHRTPYGLTFAPDGRLWELEHGPRGGDELNLIEPGKNYGWPLVSYATNYDGVPIPSPDTRSDLAKPVIYWTPVIAPGNMTVYQGKVFPQWNGSLLIGGLASRSLSRVVFDNKGGATPAERWNVGFQIRDVAVAPDGAVWVIENTVTGGLYRVMPQAPPPAATEVAADVRALVTLPARGGATLTVTTPAFKNGGDIPFENTQYKGNVFPGLSWTAGPAGTTSYAIIMQDTDGRSRTSGEPTLHWTMGNIPASVTTLDAGMSTPPAGSSYGQNYRGANQPYLGPRTPVGPKHRYHIQLFALDVTLPAEAFATYATLVAAMKDHVLASGEVVGLGQAMP